MTTAEQPMYPGGDAQPKRVAIEGVDPPRRRWGVLVWPTLVLLMGLGLGWQAAEQRARRADASLRENLLQQAESIAKAIKPEWIHRLSFTAADRGTPVFERLREQMTAYGRTIQQRSIYSVAWRDGLLVFGPENLATNDPQASPPGTVYRQPPPGLADLFKNGQSITVGPFTDEYGTFVSSFAPVLDPRTSEVLMAVGLDLAADDWQEAMLASRMLPLVGTAVLMLAFLGGLLALRWRERQPPRGQNAWRHLETALVGVLSLAVTGSVVLQIWEAERRERSMLLGRAADALERRVAEAFLQVGRDLAVLERFFNNSDQVEADEFRAFAQPMIQASTVQAVEWVPWVTAAERQGFETEHRNRTIWERDPAGERRPVTPREDYFPVTYVEPRAGNETALGYDLGSESVRRAALNKAIQTGLPTASEPVTLVQGGSRQQGLLLFQPVFGRSAERPEHSAGGSVRTLRGFALGVVRLQSLMDGALLQETHGRGDVIVHLADVGTPPEPSVLASFPPEHTPAAVDLITDSAPGRHSYQSIQPLFAFGRTYALMAHTAPAFLEYAGNRATWLVGGAGLLLTAFLTTLTAFLRNRQSYLETQVRERTAELKASELRWQFALEGAGDGLWDWNAATNRVFYSRQWKAMIGYAEHEIGDGLEEWETRVHPDDKARCYADLGRHFRGETPVYQNEHRMRCKDGSYRWILDRGKVIEWLADGKPGRVIGTHSDVSGRKQVEQALREGEERLQTILQSVQVGIIIVDAETHWIVDANPAALVLFGKSQDQVVGQECHEHICTTERGQCPVTNLGRKVDNCERVLLDSGGRRVPILKTVAPVTINGRLHLLESFVDISERKQAEEALQAAQRELATLNNQLERRVQERTAQVERLLQHQQELITHLGHDLKTPLTPLLALLPVVRDAERDPARQQMLQLALDGAHSIHAGVQRVIELCRLTEPGQHLELVSEDLRTVVETALVTCAGSLDVGGRLLTNEVPGAVRVRADDHLLQRALGYVLENAVKFTSAAGRIAIRAARQNGSVSVRVSDDGVGIEPEHLERIFEPFYKIDMSRHDHGAPGLGLTIARTIIERLGGKIWAESAGPHRGTTIGFTLPAVTTDNNDSV